MECLCLTSLNSLFSLATIILLSSLLGGAVSQVAYYSFQDHYYGVAYGHFNIDYISAYNRRGGFPYLGVIPYMAVIDSFSESAFIGQIAPFCFVGADDLDSEGCNSL
jgi:hypothetical protein